MRRARILIAPAGELYVDAFLTPERLGVGWSAASAFSLLTHGLAVSPKLGLSQLLSLCSGTSQVAFYPSISSDSPGISSFAFADSTVFEPYYCAYEPSMVSGVGLASRNVFSATAPSATRPITQLLAAHSGLPAATPSF